MKDEQVATLILDRAQERLLESLDQMSVEEANTMPQRLSSRLLGFFGIQPE